MQDFSRIRAMIDYVDKLPASTPFDYSHCDKCLFGLALPAFAGMEQLEVIICNTDHYTVRGRLCGLDEGQFIHLYQHLLGLNGYFGPGRTDKSLICRLAREQVDAWELQQQMEAVGHDAEQELPHILAIQVPADTQSHVGGHVGGQRGMVTADCV